MRVYSQYRTVIIQVYPTPSQEEMLSKCEESVFQFLNLSRVELQKMLYHKFGGLEVSRRTLNLLVQRFTGSLGEKAIIPFDEDNSRFVFEDGWFVEVQALKGRGNRIKIPIAKTELPYYDCIQDLAGFPFYLVRENDKRFIYVSIPVPNQNNGNIIGVDFNFRRWVASPLKGQPLFFDANPYSNQIERLQKLIARKQRRNEDTTREHTLIQELVKQAHGNFLAQIKKKYGVGTLAIERINVMYKMREFKSKMVNNWLYKKLAMRKFVLRAMTKGFHIEEVEPEGTTETCYRCSSPVKIYGKHERLISCETCGLKDYNRDLNAARNLAKKYSAPP